VAFQDNLTKHHSGWNEEGKTYHNLQCPHSQGLSSYRPLGGGKMRDPGNEVEPAIEMRQNTLNLKNMAN